MNIMEEYIKITQKYLTSYFRLTLSNKFSRKMSDELLKEYIDTRYYLIDEKTNRNELKTKIVKNIKNKKAELIQEYPEEKEKIELLEKLYKYVPYLDNVIKTSDFNIVIAKIVEERRVSVRKKDEDFIDNLTNLIENHNREIEQLLQKLESNQFYIEYKKVSENLDVKEVKLKYNIKFSNLYSEFAINKAFETGNTKEDRQFVEYYLLSHDIIQDFLQGKIKQQYIIELVETTIEKKQKMKRLLEIIDNPTMQDRISLRIQYSEYRKNKQEIQELMRKGFKFAIYINEFLNYEEIGKLPIFKYILLDKSSKNYDEIMKQRENLSIIEV